MPKEIIFYETAKGNCPAAKFIRTLPGKTLSKITATLEFIEQTDHPPHHLFQKMSGPHDLWEVRVKHAKNIYRLLSFFDGKQLIVVTSAFQKKTQKTPRQEIETARQRKADYLKRTQTK
jgi:phage-related protein